MRRISWALVAGALLLPSCRSDAVTLAYQFPQDSSLTYELVASAKATWNLEGTTGEGSYEVTYRVSEQVQESDGEGAVVAIQLQRTAVEEDNLPAPGDTSFTVRVSSDGSVVEVIEVNGVTAGLLAREQRSIIRTYRPQLALEPVRLYKQWAPEQAFQGSEFEQVKLLGKLAGLDTDEEGDFAELSFSGTGPLLGTAQVAEYSAELDGALDTSIDAVLDLDAGVLRSSSSFTNYDFDVSITPEDASSPIAGTLHIEEKLDLQKIEPG
ncbi:MAG: hypothetical protein M3285_04385 [Actinomycetota bacterium]|nr:hypothetical protein [Actinomycetota bacterium]